MDFVGTERFELVRRIGQGGFGTVFEAFDRHLSARVALKVLREAEGAALLKFKEEFRLFSRLSLDHPNLVNLYDFVGDERRWFFTMELVRGTPLVAYARHSVNRRFEADARVDGDAAGRSAEDGLTSVNPVRVRAAFAQLADALCEIHRHGIVHCDLKPSNVLVTADGRVVLLDFGLAAQGNAVTVGNEPSAGSVSTIFGSPAYMAPEQSRLTQVTAAADWYALGIMLYEALAGRLPFTGSPLDVLEAKGWGVATAPGELSEAVPNDLSDLTVRLLDPDPDGRPSQDEILAVLRLDLPAVAVAAPATTSHDTRDRFVGRAPQLEQLRGAFGRSTGETIVASVSGESGIGKTSLVHEFLASERDRNPDLLIFEGRCYERETMPYKAIDPLLDALARYWKSLPDRDAARLLPRDAAILAQLFPVLNHVHEVQRASLRGSGPIDLFTLRRRAAEALRDLFHKLGAPLVLVIDDAQWGDADSAAVLQQVLRTPDGPPLLLVIVSRSTTVDEASFVGRLRAVAGATVMPAFVDIEVGPLPPSEAVALVRELAGDTESEARVAAIARESGGNAFFVHELVRHYQGAPTKGAATIEMLVWSRLSTLPEKALRFVAAAAMSVQPIPASVARLAADFEPDDGDPFQGLRAARLVRAHAGANEVAFEAYHDRVRQAVADGLGPDATRDWHRRLAHAWEASPSARPETLVAHFLQAGDDEKVYRYAQLAAANAEQTLAFERAAAFYEMLVRLERDASRRLDWKAREGDALANAGRGRDAAHAYLAAMDQPRSDRSIDLERRATAELIRAGYLDEAHVLLRRLLPKVGTRPLANTAAAFLRLLAYRALLSVRGFTSQPRPESECRADLLQRIDVLFSVSEPLCFTSLIRGQALFTQASWLALRVGEPTRAFRALTGLAASLTTAGTKVAQTSEQLLAAGRARLTADATAWTRARLLLAEGIAMKNTGQVKRAIERLEPALELFSECRGVYWEVTTSQTIVHDSWLWMGEWTRMAHALPARLQAAEQRGDIYLAAYASVRTRPVLLMAADQLQRASEEVTASLNRWTSADLVLQRRSALCTRIELALYAGDAEAAHAALADAWPGLRAILLGYQFGRVEMLFYRARIALARAARNPRLLKDAERDARRLAGEGAPWASALASLVEALVLAARGKRAPAIAALQRAELDLRQADLKNFAAAARYRRGALVGAGEGDQLVGEAADWLRAQQIVNVAAVVGVLAPGEG